MPETLQRRFHAALAEMGITFGIESETPPAGLIAYGGVTLADNPDLAAAICDRVAQSCDAFPTFTAFKRFTSQSPEPPKKPKSDDPILYAPFRQSIPPEFETPKLRERARQFGLKNALQFLQKMETAYNYTLALKTHEERVQSHERLLSQIRTVRSSYSLDERGYLDWVLFSLPPHLADFAQSFFFTPRTLLIKEDDRKKHTFITGGTGSGKSETQKHLIWHYLTRKTDTALVVLDPHDKLAREVAQMAPNARNDRLVYIKPGAFKKRYIALNPFDFDAKDEESLNIAQKHFLGAFEQILGYELSDAQRAVLIPCLGVMLHRDKSTLLDLIRFMDDERNGDLVRYGCQKLPNEEDRKFFLNQFDGDNFSATKQAIAYRLAQIVRDPSVRSFLCRESTFSLEDCVEQGKLIVFGFDRAKQDAQVVTTIGQLINALLFSYSMRRGDGNGKPIHLFADECQYFVSPTIEEILGESRKFQLYATLATQRTNQVGRELLDAIFGNVGCFLIGRNRSATAEKMGKELEIKADEIRALAPLQFFQVGLDQPPTKTKISYIGGTRKMNREDWRDVLLTQRERYYRFTEEFGARRTVSDFNDTREHHGGIQPQDPPALSQTELDEIASLPPIPDVSKRP